MIIDHTSIFILLLLILPKGHKTEERAKFKHWAKNNFRKTTIEGKDILICLKIDYPVVTRDEVFNVIHKCHLRTEHSGRDTT